MGRTSRGREWVGGRLSAPMYITEGEPYRPDVILWVELPEGWIVGSEVVTPTESPAVLADTLLAAMRRPMIGPPRRPDRIRVADPALAEVVRAALGPATDIRVAPTPELDDVMHEMARAGGSAGDDAESYLENGRVSPQAVAELFRAAQRLFTVAPWKRVSDTDVLRVDIPQLGVHGACLSIIGALGESIGILLFPSLAGFDAFLDAAERTHQGGAVDLNTTWLSLSFERGADIAPAMRREVAAHGWPVENAEAYPRVAFRDRDGVSRPLTEKDLRLVTACVTSLSAFFVKHGALSRRGPVVPVCESYSDRNDLTVRLTFPYEAADLFDVLEPLPAAPPAAPRVGRNDPCPCGSGRKYKKCHLGTEPPPARHTEGDDTVHADDARLVGAILNWAARRYGSAWAGPLRDAKDEGIAAQLVAPWCAYHASVGGRRIAEGFLEAQAERVSADDRAWIASQLAAWLSIWEVAEVEPGVGVHMTDLLSGETRYVRERSGSRTLVRRDAVLARVVDHRGSSTFCGLAPRLLPPQEAAEVVRRVRAKLRLRRAVAVEHLRDEATGRFMLARWAEAVADLDHRASIPPTLQNTDGDALLFTTDHFGLGAGPRGEVARRLTALGAIAAREPGTTEQCYEFVRAGAGRHADGEATIIGRVRLTDRTLVVETNSVARADHLRQRIGDACGDLLRHRIREHSDPRALLAQASGADDPAPALDPSEAARIEREYKQRHYQRWLDEPVPALGGKTPRETARTAAGRPRVDVLLKDMENRESRLPAGQRFDFAALRRDLGLDP